MKPNHYPAGSVLLCALGLERATSPLPPPQQVQGLAHNALASRHAPRAHPCTARTQPLHGGAAPAALADPMAAAAAAGARPHRAARQHGGSAAAALQPCANGPPWRSRAGSTDRSSSVRTG